MAILPLRAVRLPVAAEQFYDGWLADLEAELAAPDADWYRLARDLLFQIHHPGAPDYDALLQDPATPEATRIALLSLDPRNVTLEPEYYAEVDADRFARVKPLLWLWQGFDRSPIGHSVHLGVRFRRLLARHIFARVGRNFKAFQYVEFSFGYNMEVGDDVVVHRNVLLDDRGGILEDDVRITYHATVLAGVRVGRNAMVGANAVATKDVRPYHVNVGIPAKSIRVKPNAPPEAYVTERVSRRDTRES
jgi:acetyltransferase-like isoleucine patch superfamily enzyme